MIHGAPPHVLELYRKALEEQLGRAPTDQEVEELAIAGRQLIDMSWRLSGDLKEGRARRRRRLRARTS